MVISKIYRNWEIGFYYTIDGDKYSESDTYITVLGDGEE